MAINLIEGYKQLLEERYKHGSVSQDLFTNGVPYQWADEKTIKIPKLSTTGFRDHSRGVAIGTVEDYDNDFELYTLSHDRDKKFGADVMDITESGLARSIANLTHVFDSEHRIPETDAYVFSKLYSDFTTAGKTADTTTITKDNILTVHDDIIEKFDNDGVPQEGRLCYCTAGYLKLLKQAIDKSRTYENNDSSIGRGVTYVDGVKYILVPEARFKTEYDFTLGFTPTETAKQIQAMYIHPSCQVSTMRLNQALLDEPSAKTDGKYIFFTRQYWDANLIKAKTNGIYFIVK